MRSHIDDRAGVGLKQGMQSRILIVEDDPLVAMMLEGFLEALDRQALGPVDSVQAALARLDEGNIDAAIVDVHLANGETSEPVAEALGAGSIPFIVTTGGFIAPPGPVFAGRPVLLKPFTMASFEQALSAFEEISPS